LSNFPRPKIKPVNLRQVTENTRFYIDFDWWEEERLDLRAYLMARLSMDNDAFSEVPQERIDLIDSKTGEVRQVDAFQYLMRNYFNRQGASFATQGSIVDAVFSVLLANGNEPMTVREIAERVQRPSDLLIKTFGGSQIYQGIRPLFDEV
jgi:hypothetical protein